MKKNTTSVVVNVSTKPRNYVALALSKRNGAGNHEKNIKSQRALDKIKLKKNLGM